MTFFSDFIVGNIMAVHEPNIRNESGPKILPMHILGLVGLHGPRKVPSDPFPPHTKIIFKNGQDNV